MKKESGIKPRKIERTIKECEKFLMKSDYFTVKVADREDILVDEVEFNADMFTEKYLKDAKKKSVGFVREMFDDLGIVNIISFVNQFDETLYIVAESFQGDNFKSDLFHFEIKSGDE